MNVREFIESFLISEIGKLRLDYPFQSFTLMATGIEFLGKCLTMYPWDVDGKSSEEFKKAIDDLENFEKYRGIDQLYKKLRCGLAHLGIPKIGIMLDRNKNALENNPVIIGCDEFYEDFKNACIEVLENKNGVVKKNLDENYAIIEGTITASTQSNT